ncbi:MULTISPECIES: thioesterase II family protein [unclassified Streptomyces]|uniref:thioesterase II family protein n=1 Tax=unclassified Streptomyces TaxID=2593676 RepID=UPI00225C2A7E|nr:MULTISPECIES: alpha/beta fold hydrolase [unclassified Streptomyces]MCX5047750.1 alpha/beta fold hydrolase [Streptomyces sp. NBC_00474]MCX5057562.1 alpha/beta fold hydrolase [Streptomyces sp. NBC_00452]MCX5288637.1 alpha/beta fold hydrolase [Streptomyces sp. NBC_00183]
MAQSAAERLLKKWFPYGDGPGSGPRLYALPHAGGAASAYREWIAELAPATRVVPVQLPGREGRFGEPMADSVQAVAAEAAQALIEHAQDGPFVLFGHSMGALIAFELACALTEAGRAPDSLVVSGYAAPHLVRESPAVHLMSDGQLRDHLASLGGTRAEVLTDPALLELLAPTIRADYRLCDSYVCERRTPLEIPVSAIGGLDDPRVGAEELTAWAHTTAGPFRVRRFPGAHFYLGEQRDEVLGFLLNELTVTRSEP